MTLLHLHQVHQSNEAISMKICAYCVPLTRIKKTVRINISGDKRPWEEPVSSDFMCYCVTLIVCGIILVYDDISLLLYGS